MNKYVGVSLWTLAAVMAANALLLPGNLPQGWYRVGLWVIVFAFSGIALFNFLWGRAKGHRAASYGIGLFVMYSFLLYMTAVPGLTSGAKRSITFGMMLVPLLGLLILRDYRESSGKKAFKRGQKNIGA